MRLASSLANKILNEVKSLTTENIIIVNPEGIIIASTDQIRIGQNHEGARIVMKTKEKLYIDYQMGEYLQGVKPGINLPIIFDKSVVGVIGITGIPTDVEPFAELIRGVTELIIREANYIEKREWKTRGLESFFYEWIFSNEIDEKFINRGEILGISFNEPYQCILFQIEPILLSEDQLQIQHYIERWFEERFTRSHHDFLIRWGHGRFLIIRSTEQKMSYTKLAYELSQWQQHFKKRYHASLAIGIGKTIESRVICNSYQEAKKALKVAEKDNSIIFYDSLLLEIILEEMAEKTKNEYIEKVLAPIEKDSELVETLQIYLKNNQSLKKSSNILHIHINTLHYRLNQIKVTTGIDPKSSEGVALFYIALSLIKLL